MGAAQNFICALRYAACGPHPNEPKPGLVEDPGLRREEGIFYFAYPALIPQRALRVPRERTGLDYFALTRSGRRREKVISNESLCSSRRMLSGKSWVHRGRILNRKDAPAVSQLMKAFYSCHPERRAKSQSASRKDHENLASCHVDARCSLKLIFQRLPRQETSGDSC